MRLLGRRRAPGSTAAVTGAISDQFLNEVLPGELAYIEERRRTVFEGDPENPRELPASSNNQLLGLAFSGGGIRSATFNLGVLQALERHGVFQFVDYLSTVSGGGFLGCALSTLLAQRARSSDGPPREFPLRFSEAEEEMPAVSYLRNNSNYLAPRGMLDYLRIFAVLVRGIILNFLVLVPFLLMSSLVVTVIYGQALLERLQRDDNLAELTDLLERNWIGLGSDQPVQELLAALEQRGMLDTQRGMTRAYVIEWLRGDEKRSGQSGLRALPALIKGSADEDAEQFEFRDDVSMEDIVERLWDSQTLRNLDALREIDAVEQAVRASPDWQSSRKRRRLWIDGECRRPKLSLENLYFTLSRIRDAESGKPLLDPMRDRPERMLEALRSASGRELLVEQVEETPCPDDDGPPLGIQASSDGPLAGWRAAGSKPNLRRIIQELYARGFYNPQWVKENRNPSPTGRSTPPLGYWEPYELATIESVLRASAVPDLEPAAPGAPTRDRFPDLALVRASGLLVEGREDEAGEILDSLGDRRDAGIWRSLAIGLWDRGLIDELALQRKFNELEIEGHVLAYRGQRAADSARTAGKGWDPYEQPFRGTLVLIVAGLVWVLLYPLLLLVGRIGGIRRIAELRGAPWWRDLYERSFALFLVLVVVVAFVELQPFLIYHYRRLQGGEIWWPLGIGAASLAVSMVAGPAIAFFRGSGKAVMLVVVALMGPVLPLLVYIHLVLWVIYRQFFWSGYYDLDRLPLVVFFTIAAVGVHIFNLGIDVNSTSLHGFYRDRLSAAYLMRTIKDQRSTGASEPEREVVVPGEDLQLDRICDPRSGAPYHLINATLNLQGAKDPALRRRRGDFFQFSSDFVGSKQTGFCETRALLQVFPHLYVSSAMAVSAAAASPNMGTFTSGPLVVLMSLLNIRLGFWLPNPRRIERLVSAAGHRSWLLRLMAVLFGSFQARPGAYQLLREMLSDLRADVPLVNLSDGGHMENTGAYQLLKRRCQFIIVGDAEADPEMRFGGLAALMRYARIDLGIEIDIHVDDLRLDDEGESRQHAALGVILYPETETAPADVGYLLYIKASITGDESEVVYEHHLKSPLFPHESTADQSFEEGQFEAYRDLGFHICDGLFDGFHKKRVDTFEECSEWFEMLSITLSPGLAGQVAFSDIPGALRDIRGMLREPGYSHYFYEIYPELESAHRAVETPSAEEEAEAFRNVFHLVTIQLQLMESIFVSSQLAHKANRRHPANRGWMNLFRRWSKAPSFRRAYLASVTTFSAPFQQFCQSALGLELKLRWESRPDQASAPEDGESLMLTARLEGTTPVHIAETVVAIEDGAAKVRDLQMRSGYQGAGMRARSMLALKDWARERKLVLGFSEAASVAARSEEFDYD